MHGLTLVRPVNISYLNIHWTIIMQGSAKCEATERQGTWMKHISCNFMRLGEQHFRNRNIMYNSVCANEFSNVDKEEKIGILRKMIQDDPALCNFPYENDKLLERFLRGTAFDVEEAFQKIKLYYKLILEHPEWFTKEAPLNRKHLLEKDVRIALPAATDKDGRPVYVAKLGNCDPSKMALLDVIAVDDIWIESILLNSDPEKGLCVLLDIANLPWKSIKWLTPHNIMVGLKKLQCLPFKDFRFHVVNNSFILNAALKIVWPFLPEDIKKTVKFHFNNRDSLHGFIDPDVLPDEYGGRKGDIKYREIYEQLYAQNEEIFESLQLQRNLVVIN